MAQATLSTAMRSHLVHVLYRDIPFILNIKKTARVIILDIPNRRADLSPPAYASMPLKVQHFHVLSQILLLAKLWSSLTVSPLDEHTIANIG